MTNYSDATKAADADVAAIKVGGVAIDGFDPAVSTYVVDWPRGKRIPAVSAVPAQSGARVKVSDGSSVLSSAGHRFSTRTIKVTSADGSVTRTYTVGFQLTDRDERPVAAGGHGGDRAAGTSGLLGGGDAGAGPGGGGGLWSPAAEWADPLRIARGRGAY
ncbi:hypothetical protein [Streptomyces nigra]|uniref:hypothetical protein n=1 Tax=Streptomyces nigra TaxID=1827580 RepID=UPI00382999E1